MTIGSRFVVLGAMLAAAAVTWIATRGRGAFDDAAASLRTSSAPSARLYERLGWLIGGLYDRFAAEAAEALAGVPSPSVLEIGPGPGEVAVRLARLVPDLRLVGLDIDPSMVALAGARAERAGVDDRVRFVVGDVAAMPFDAASFDLVVSSFSAHHWPDGAMAFAEIRRVLCPGGRAIVYDLPDGWGRLETGANGLVDAAAGGGFVRARFEPVRWPWRLALVRRLEVVRDPGPGGRKSGGA